VGRECGLETAQVQPEIRAERHFQQAAAGLRNPVEERRIDRRADHDGVAGPDQHAQHLDHADADVGDRGHRRRVGPPAPAALRERGERLAQVPGPAGA
jgi:hypothetical protein